MATSQYWMNRLQQIAHSIYNNQEQKNQKLLQEYKTLYGNIQSQMDELYRKYGDNGVLTTTEMYRFNRLNNLQANIKKQVNDLGENEETFLGKSLYQNFQDVVQQTTQFINKSSGLNVDWSYLDDKFITSAIKQNWQGGNFSTRSWLNKDKLLKSLNSVIVSGISSGQSINNMAADLKNAMGVGAYDALRLARTETMHILNNGQLTSFKNAGYGKVIWLTAEDERVCDICGPLDGKKFDVNNPPDCPAHPNCRCTLAADPDSLDTSINSGPSMVEDGNTFTEAGSITEANSYAKDVLGIENVSYKGCDITTANDWNRGLTDAFNKFPELKNNFGFAGESHERNKMVKDKLIEDYTEKLVELNPNASESTLKEIAKNKASKFIKRYLSISKNSLADSWCPKTECIKNFKGITVNKDWGKDSKAFTDMLKLNVKSEFHPVGCDTIKSTLDHEIGHQLDNLLDIGKIPDIQAIFDERTEDELTKDLSKYAWKNSNSNRYSEMIAEAWAEYCNNPEPREIAKQIGQTIESEYAKKFGGAK